MCLQLLSINHVVYGIIFAFLNFCIFTLLHTSSGFGQPFVIALIPQKCALRRDGIVFFNRSPSFRYGIKGETLRVGWRRWRCIYYQRLTCDGYKSRLGSNLWTTSYQFILGIGIVSRLGAGNRKGCGGQRNYC